MLDKPKMYHNKIDKVFHNNKVIYMSSNDKVSDNKINDVRNKIDMILNDSSFIYRTKVNILIDNKLITKKIIGIRNNNLVTIDNEYIPIDNIQDIYK